MGVTPIKVPQSLAIILNSAGERSGVDFDYLLQTAIRESSLNPTAKAQTSSATGLFQFLEATWLQVMKEEGPRLGYQSYADAITETRDGDYVIKDKELRKEVLKLREDPQVAADMAAAFTRNNGKYLQDKFGRMPSPGELYIAHFLGAKGAEKMFTAGLADPDQIAAKLFPKQAKANRAIFYDNGEPRTIREVYKSLVAKHTASSVPPIDAGFAAQQLISAPLPTGNLAYEVDDFPLPDFEVPQVGGGTGTTPELPVPLTPSVPADRSLIAYAGDGTPLVEAPAYAAGQESRTFFNSPVTTGSIPVNPDEPAKLPETGVIPSRYAASETAAAALFAQEASTLPRTLISPKGWEGKAGFFTRPYGQ